jgi:hypothetical protein
VSQSSEFCSHNPLCCFSTSVYCCLFRYRHSPETFGYTLVFRATDILLNLSSSAQNALPETQKLSSRHHMTRYPSPKQAVLWVYRPKFCHVQPVCTSFRTFPSYKILVRSAAAAAACRYTDRKRRVLSVDRNLEISQITRRAGVLYSRSQVG